MTPTEQDKRDARDAALQYIDRHGLSVRDLAWELNVSRTMAQDLLAGDGTGPTIKQLQGVLGRSARPRDAWGDEEREKLKVLLSIFSNKALFESNTAVSYGAATAATEPGSRPSKPVRRLLRQFIYSNSAIIEKGES